MADITLFAGGARAREAKEVGVPRVQQQWKEGLRSDFEKLMPVSREEEEVEQLRVLLRRGQGIGTFTDAWTPYTGPDKDLIIERALEGYMNEDTERSGTDHAPVDDPNDDVGQTFNVLTLTTARVASTRRSSELR